MTPDFTRLLQALPGSPPTVRTLRRLVSRDALNSRTPPDYLYTTGYAYRVNTSGSLALYGAEDAATAGAEWERHAAKAPRIVSQVLYLIETSLAVVDLGDPKVLSSLQLNPGDLVAPWEFVAAATNLQLLGDAVARQTRFGAVRFPSDAARVRGFGGFNLAIFPSAVVAPMSVVICNDAGTEMQHWPK